MRSLSEKQITRGALPAGRGPWIAVAILVLTMVIPQLAFSQVLYGTLSGHVTDQSGAVAVGAKVVVVNVATNVSKTATTNDTGFFQMADLQPGVYEVTFEAENLQTSKQTGVRVDSNSVRRVDARLQVSGLVETVEVTASAAPLQTDRADVHVTQTPRQINELPITGSSGRNYQSLMQIVPGAVMQGEQNSAAGSPQRSISFNVNGVSRMQNSTRLDGASIAYPWLPTNTAYVPSAEAIEEVSIVTNAFNAEQGMAGGAAINVVIKSGSNAFHGTAWGYSTNSAWKARNYFQTPPRGFSSWQAWDDASGDKPDKNNPDVLNQFGANFGGPIIKDKLFFFANWEHTQRTNDSPVRLYSLAPADIRNGDFSATGVTIYDPASNADPSKRTPFPGNIIPANRIDPAAAWFIQRMPLPTSAGYVNNYTAKGEGKYERDNVDVKLNYHASDRLSVFGRYSISPSNITDPSALGEVGGDALNGGQVGTAPGRTHVAGAGLTYAFSTNVVLDANLGFTHQKLGAENVDIDTNYGLDVLGIPGTNGPDRLQGGIPSFQVGGWANLGNPNTGNPFQFNDDQYVASANLSWMKQNHTFRFGLDYQNQQLNHFQPQGGTFQTARGTFQFNGNSTRLQNGPTPADTRYNSWADFLLGLPNAAGKVEQLRNPNSVYMQTYALYAQDQWQVSRKLTLNAGVRWELYGWPDPW